MKKHSGIGLIILVYVAFIALGMPDGLLGVAWPSIRSSFSLPLDSAGLLLTTFVIGYLISSFSGGPFITNFGVGKILAYSCAITGIGLIGYTLVPFWWMVVILGAVVGLGAGAIDTGLNSYAAAHFNTRLMQWLHASYGIGITLSPIIMTISITSISSWRLGYIIVGGFQLVLALCFMLMLPKWNQKNSGIRDNKSKLLTDYKTSFTETLTQPKVWLSVMLFFLYTGAEFSLGTWIYTLLVESRGINQDLAGLMVSSFWITFTIGRIAAGIITKFIGINRLVMYSLISSLFGAILLWWNPVTILSLSSIALIGLAIAPIFPALISGTSKRVGIRFSANTIGIQMASGGLGAAVIPSAAGILARRISLEVIPICLIILFTVLIGLYSLSVYSLSKT